MAKKIREGRDRAVPYKSRDGTRRAALQQEQPRRQHEDIREYKICPICLLLSKRTNTHPARQVVLAVAALALASAEPEAEAEASLGYYGGYGARGYGGYGG